MKPSGGLEQSSDEGEEDSDMEENFVLLTEGKRAGRIEEHQEEEEGSDGEEDGDDGGNDEEAEDENLEDDQKDSESDDVKKKDDDNKGDDDNEDNDDDDDDDAGDDDDDDDDDDDEDDNDEDDDDDDDDNNDDDEDDNNEDDDDNDDDDEGGTDDGSSNLQTREDVKKELSTMSFEELIELQNKVGTKAYQQVAYGDDKDGKKKRPMKRLNKNRPMEVSSKRPVSFIRQVVPVKKPIHRDPRFDDLSGEYKADIFWKTHKFIDDVRRREMEVVQKNLKKTKGVQKKEKLDFLLKRMKNQQRARESEEQRRERELQFKREQRERASQGARPYFLKNSDKKKIHLAERYQQLKTSGRLEQHLTKKRKKNAGKDRRKLPPKQRSSND